MVSCVLGTSTLSVLTHTASEQTFPFVEERSGSVEVYTSPKVWKPVTGFECGLTRFFLLLLGGESMACPPHLPACLPSLPSHPSLLLTLTEKNVPCKLFFSHRP